MNIWAATRKNHFGQKYFKMRMTFSAETRVFLFSICFGALVVLVFKTLTCLAEMFKLKKIALAISDIIFSLICFVGAVSFLATEGKYRIESYVLVGMVIGVALFLLIFSSNKNRICDKRAKY